MTDFLLLVIVVSLISAFAITLLRKWGFVEWGQVHGNDFFAKMFSCDFCLSWWVGVIVSLFAFILTADALCIVVPFCSTPLTRKLL